MGMPLWAWIVFYVLVFIMLIADLKMFGKKGQHEVKVKEALQMTAVWIGVSLVFCVAIYLWYPVESHEKAMEFLAGYLIEKSLSMDNLFVFLMLFSFFGIERKYQHEVLFWGTPVLESHGVWLKARSMGMFFSPITVVAPRSNPQVHWERR